MEEVIEVYSLNFAQRRFGNNFVLGNITNPFVTSSSNVLSEKYNARCGLLLLRALAHGFTLIVLYQIYAGRHAYGIFLNSNAYLVYEYYGVSTTDTHLE